jgi:hypothetical protein
MTRGYRPVVAIGEAQRKAVAWGLRVMNVEAETRLPFDFVVDDRGRTSLVRVRRLKYAGYGTAGIERTCRQQLAELRQLPDLGSVSSELWVRGPDRSWHRYQVGKDSLEPCGDSGPGEMPAGDYSSENPTDATHAQAPSLQGS